MSTARFTVLAKTGYDFGHLAPRDRGLIGVFDNVAEAIAARDAFNAAAKPTNHGAAFDYAEIYDREDEHAVVGFGHYGNGQRITSVRPILALAASDDVLFRGTRQQCATFCA
jgi:hypothetical protein